MVYDRLQAEEILARAQELDTPAADVIFDADSLQRLADELGVSRQALAQAIDESAGGSSGPLVVQAGATIQQSVEDVTESVGAFLRLRGLVSTGWSVWEQATGWWPDVYRYRVQTPVSVAVSPAASATRVVLTARLDRVARAHVLLGLLAPLWLAILIGRGVSFGEVAEWVVPAVMWVVAAVFGFFYRRSAVSRRLTEALSDIARPGYRSVPW